MDNPSARTFWEEINIQTLPGEELLFTGDVIDAEQAEQIGLVSRVVPHDSLAAAARELAERIAAA